MFVLFLNMGRIPLYESFHMLGDFRYGELFIDLMSPCALEPLNGFSCTTMLFNQLIQNFTICWRKRFFGEFLEQDIFFLPMVKFVYIGFQKINTDVQEFILNIPGFGDPAMLVYQEHEHAINKPVLYHQRTYGFHENLREAGRKSRML